MRVMIFADTFSPQVNGVATSVATLARTLHQNGHSVIVCTAGSFAAREADLPYVVVRARGLRLPLYSDFLVAPPVGSRFASLMRRFRPDVVHCHTPFSVGWQGLRAARMLGIPVVGTHHTLFGDYVEAYSRLGKSRLGKSANARIARAVRRYTASFYNQCDLVTCASRYLAADLAAGGLSRPVTIVPNPLDTELFHPLPGGAATPGAAPRIVYCGRLAAEKNLPLLLRVMAPLLRRWPSATLEFIGNGPVRQHLERQSEMLGVGDRVQFAGWLHGEELTQRIASATVAVSASTTENQPMALLESLACGVPVVALAAGGVPEILTDGENGFLVDRETPELMAQRVERLLRDGHLRARMGKRARASTEAYSHAACMRRTLDAYVEATHQHGVRHIRGAR